MKLLPVLAISLFCTSCGLIQMPARLIHTALGPLVDAETSDTTSTTSQIALRVHAPAPARRTLKK